MTTIYVAPAGLDEPLSQCRIYAAQDGIRYNHTSKLWKEVGLMGSDGSIICIESIFSDLKYDVPLMAGTYYPMGE